LRTFAVPLLVFMVALGLCAADASASAKPSHDNPHYVHLADGWLDGRLALEGKPPGWCTTELRRAKKASNTLDDWARV
jgi:hypothetical protein